MREIGRCGPKYENNERERERTSGPERRMTSTGKMAIWAGKRRDDARSKEADRWIEGTVRGETNDFSSLKGNSSIWK